MATGYWTQTRPNGKPIDEGTFAWVTEAPGVNPVTTYGKTVDEVLEKLSLQLSHSQAAMARRTAEPAPKPSAAPNTPATPRKRLSVDETAQAVLDIQVNPAKAAKAIVALVEDETGRDLREEAADKFFDMAQKWEESNPDLFFPHAGNRRLVMEKARDLAGGDLTRATEQILFQSVEELKKQNLLFEPEVDPQQQEPPPSSSTFPGESPVQRTERPRGSRFAQSTRSTRFAAPQVVAPKTLKYTEAQFRSLSSDRSRALIQAGDKDYEAACEAYGQAVTA